MSIGRERTSAGWPSLAAPRTVWTRWPGAARSAGLGTPPAGSSLSGRQTGARTDGPADGLKRMIRLFCPLSRHPPPSHPSPTGDNEPHRERARNLWPYSPPSMIWSISISVKPRVLQVALDTADTARDVLDLYASRVI